MANCKKKQLWSVKRIRYFASTIIIWNNIWMCTRHMSAQYSRFGKRFATHLTHMRTFTIMRSHMTSHIILLGKRFWTKRARMTFACMHFHVATHAWQSRKQSRTQRTLMILIARMSFLMKSHRVPSCKFALAYSALEWLLAGMCAHMAGQRFGKGKRTTTHVTRTVSLSSVHTTMQRKGVSTMKRFAAYIASKWSIVSVIDNVVRR